MKFHRTSSTLASLGLAIASIVGFSVVSLSEQMTQAAIAQEAAPTVTTRSNTNQIGLAIHLRNIGAKLYTAYWCPHCQYQKERFGLEAVQELEVVECDRRGVNPQPDLCTEKGIKGYPTWEINGELYSGNRSLINLANLSGYLR